MQTLESPLHRQFMLYFMNKVDFRAEGGALVPARDLRQVMIDQNPAFGKIEFDQLMLRMSVRGIISLHQHDFPAGCTQAQRDEMIFIDGAYYVGVALRKN